ncbi:DMT family transporter [Ammoniphilus sp. CFH 90114]|uniref:DMT family transporter n=1 Tax=Ammoniphilus sp. CFH 90114 TaxID=2493665 RepID=UPI00100FF508|nr:DMT family transporter [Ammoniphilus sp. CFH 90114]RXT06390.1 DMT family transporter [Ammoniphilus sp. CFH 90114]
MKQERLWLTYITLAVATSIWGTAFIAGKYAVESFEPITVAFLRFLGATLILYPYMRYREKDRAKPTPRDWGLFAVLGLTGIAIYNICFFMASKYAPVIKSSLLIASNPVFITLFAGLFLKEVISKNHIVGMVMALLGVGFIISQGKLDVILGLQFEFIDLILLGAILSWAAYSVVGKVVLNKYNAVVSTTYACAFGTLFLFPFTIMETTWADITQASLASWLSILHMSIFVTVVSFIMYYDGIRKIGASKASIFINVMPVSAVALSVIILGEQFQFYHFIGAFMVLGGVYISTLKLKTMKSSKNEVKSA